MRIKYMGTSDVRTLSKGEDFDGALAPEAALTTDLRWDEDNRFTIDTTDDKLKDVPAEFWTELLAYGDGEFKDVSGLKRIPPSEGQKLWRGAKAPVENPHVEVADDSESTDSDNEDDTDETPKAGVGSDAGATAAGGSTPRGGARRRSTS